jgi:hypothetical protein
LQAELTISALPPQLPRKVGIAVATVVVPWVYVAQNGITSEEVMKAWLLQLLCGHWRVVVGLYVGKEG